MADLDIQNFTPINLLNSLSYSWVQIDPVPDRFANFMFFTDLKENPSLLLLDLEELLQLKVAQSSTHYLD
jgi:hypothetical protein